MVLSASHRKIYKLIFIKKGFLSDMFKKIKKAPQYHIKNNNLLKPKQDKSQYEAAKFTVISAVYNVGKYLDDYFDAMVNQTLDFKNSIHLIMVDDGSTDNSEKIIKKWQETFPNNITYINKKNGGQGSARNVGIALTKTPWLTFIDPDDYVDYTYFNHVDRFLEKNHKAEYPARNINFISCNFILFFEKSNEYRDAHPLRFRYEKKETVLDADNKDNLIQLNVNNVFFSTDIIKNNRLKFDERRWPVSEDHHFMARYLLTVDYGKFAYLKEPKYYYRKRLDGTSSLDTSKVNKKYFIDVLKESTLGIIKYALEHKGAVPVHIQRTLCYDMSWRIKELRSNPSILNGLEIDEKQEYFNLLKVIYSYVDDNVINEYSSEINGFDYFHKAGVFSYFKHKNVPSQLIYITAYSSSTQTVHLKYFYHELPRIEFFIGPNKLDPSETAVIAHKLVSEPFVFEQKIKIRILTKSEKISVKIDGQNIPICLGEALFLDSCPHSKIEKYFSPPAVTYKNKIHRVVKKYNWFGIVKNFFIKNFSLINKDFSLINKKLDVERKLLEACYINSTNLMFDQVKLPVSKNSKIKIRFLYKVDSWWCSLESFYQACLQDERLDVELIYLDVTPFPGFVNSQTEHAEDFLKKNNISYISVENYDINIDKPHVLVYQWPYNSLYEKAFPQFKVDMVKKQGIRPVYISYGIEFDTDNNLLWMNYNLPIHQFAWRIFPIHTDVQHEFYQHCRQGGGQTRVLGHPRFDFYFTNPKVRLPAEIYDKVGSKPIVVVQLTFMKENERLSHKPISMGFGFKMDLIACLQKHDDIFTIVTLHPKMKSEFIDKKTGTKEDWDGFIESIENHPNSCLYNGDYRVLFLNAKAFVTEKSSLMVEMAYLGKPVLYLSQNDIKFKPFASDLFSGFYKAKNLLEVETFVESLFDPGNERGITEPEIVAKHLKAHNGKVGYKIKESIVEDVISESVYK